MTDKADKVHPIVEKMARAIANANVEGGTCEPSPHAIECAKAAAKVLLNMEPTEKMLDAGVAFALNVTISGDYRWTDYVRDKHKHMTAALSSEMGLEG